MCVHKRVKNIDCVYRCVLTICVGITHSDELIYLYPRTGKPLNEEDTEIAKLMVQIYGNFITTG
jgi:hypothetical protein